MVSSSFEVVGVSDVTSSLIEVLPILTSVSFGG